MCILHGSEYKRPCLIAIGYLCLAASNYYFLLVTSLLSWDHVTSVVYIKSSSVKASKPTSFSMGSLFMASLIGQDVESMDWLK